MGMEWIRGDGVDRANSPAHEQDLGKSWEAGKIPPTTILRGASSSSVPTFGRKTPQSEQGVRFSLLPEIQHQASDTSSGSTVSIASETSNLLRTVSQSKRQLYPPETSQALVSSIRDRRKSDGRTIPQLQLNREAIAPALWIDQDVCDRSGGIPDGAYGGIEETRGEHIDERSAVTPQLPVIRLDESQIGSDWSSEAEERMISIYGKVEWGTSMTCGSDSA